MKSIEEYWYGSNRLVWLLLPMSALYCSIIYIRRKLYQLKLKKSFSFQVPVVVVGNIVVGGSGKTPLLISMCEYLCEKGFKPGVVSRGYGGSVTGLKQVSFTDKASLVGDEPLMIFQRTKLPVVIGADRVSAVKYLLDNNQCDIVLSDDGLQHYRMQRDIEIAVIDSNRKFGNGFCLPAGPLREPVSRLKDVDLTIYNGTNINTDTEYSYTLQLTAIKSLNNIESRKLVSFIKTDVIHAVAGIGNPERFFEQLTRNGLKITKHAFPDHHNYTQNDFYGWADACIIMTEKDAVKCHHLELPDAWIVIVDADMSVSFEEKLTALLMPLLSNEEKA